MEYISFNRIIDAVSILDKNQKELLLKILQETISPLKQLLLESTSYTMETSGAGFSKYYESRLLAICA